VSIRNKAIQYPLRQKRTTLPVKHSQAFIDLVNEARAQIPETTCQAIHERLQAGEKLTLIDVREKDEWDRGHLPGAIHLSKGIIERDVEGAFPEKGAELVLYCGGGYRSALAALNLKKMGYTRAVSMDGGWRTWTEQGYPTS